MTRSRPLLVALRPLGLGDLLTVVPALRALADAFPDHRRILGAPAALARLAMLTGSVDAVAATAPLRPLGPELRGADVAVNLHGRGPQSHRVLLAAHARRLIAFAHPAVPQSAGGPRWNEQEHEVRRWCRLLVESGIPCDPARLDLRPPDLEPPTTARGATVIHPGAAFPARRWPVERFAAVAAHQRASGRPVVITGSSGEAGLAGDLARMAGLPAEAVLAGRTDLAQLAAIVAAADRVVCADTGMAHLATAIGTPSVVLFGPEPPSRWGPPQDRPQHVALWAGRSGDPHGSDPDPGLVHLQAEEVIAALDALPGRQPLAGGRRVR